MERADVEAKLKSDLFKTRERTGLAYRSSNWSMFKEIVSDEGNLVSNFVYCTNCAKVISYNPSKGTNNLNRHRTACSKKSTGTIEKYMVRPINFLPKDKAGILDAAKKFCYQDLRPFSAIEGDGLIKLLHEVSSVTNRYGLLSENQIRSLLPCRTTVRQLNVFEMERNLHLQNFYFLQIQRNLSNDVEQKRKELIKQLHTAIENTSLSCTTDVWTDKIRHISYLGVTAHFVELDKDENLSMQTKFLGLSYFDAEDIKDGPTINEKLKSILDVFELNEKRFEINFVTDRGTPMISGLTNYKRNNCVAHFLNNIVGAAVKEISDTIRKISRIVKYMKVTGLNTNLKVRLVSYVCTRWNSVFEMFDSLLTSWTEIEHILSRKDNEITRAFQTLSRIKLVAIRDYLELYKLLTVEVEGEKEVTSTKICSVVEYIITHNEIRTADIGTVKCMKKDALEYFENNRSAIAKDYLLYAFLNPL